MDILSIIEKKKAGQELSGVEIEWVVEGYLEGRLPDYQVASLLMAVCLRGMDERETVDLTRAMLLSGRKLEVPPGPPVVDKHSTGGVGDKVSVALAPLAASLGLRVPMISGRTLGHTGGTLDKLESIPGYRALLTAAEMELMLESVGCFVSGQTDEMAPADRKLYALRDATATVDSIPLITASILSKKLSEGIDALVMDVKFGSGAFMRTSRAARALARSLTATGERLGTQVRVLLTGMEEPLGRAVGNALEVVEAIGLLEGKGPRDLERVTWELAAEMLIAGALAASRREALSMVREAVSSGAALERLKMWVEAQGGRLDYSREDLGLDMAPLRCAIASKEAGFVRRLEARSVGLAVVALGGGRRRMEDRIDHGTGIVLEKKVGDRVERGEPVAVIYARDRASLEEAKETAARAFSFSEEPPARGRLVIRL